MIIMLKRVAVVGGAGELVDAYSNAAQSEDVEVLGIEPDGAVPVGTVSIVSTGADPGALVEAAVRVGQWQEEMLQLLAQSLDCREGLAANSSRRVQDIAARFGQALGCTRDQQLTLERGALVRDIGKIKIPNEVLLKEGVLTYDEWVMLQQHPVAGADLLQPGSLQDTTDIVRYHHECFDGDGYPEGLAGDRIPLLARIIKIVDVYCAMTSPRHYRNGLSSHDEALDHLTSERGKHYDPELLDVFIENNVADEWT